MKNLRHLGYCICATGILLAAPSTNKGQSEGSAPKGISEYVRSLKPLATPALPSQQGWNRIGDQWERTVAKMEDFNQFIILDANASTVWPGSIIQGTSLQSPALTSIALPRKPITLLMSNVRGRVVDGKAKPLTVTVDQPNAGTVSSAVAQLLADVDPASTTPQIAYNQVEFNSLEQAFQKIGVSFKSISTNIRGQLESASYSERHNLLVDFSQRYYTVSVIPQANPASFFAPDVTVEDIKEVATDGNPPVFLTDVVYGRRLVLLFSSTASWEELRAAINASYSGIVAGGDVSAMTAAKKVFSQTDLRGLVVGGEGVSAIGLFTGESILTALKRYLESGAVLSNSSTGAPISYRANYLKDNSMAELQMLSYDRETQPATETRYFLRWFNHYEPNVTYRVTRNMQTNGWGDKGNKNGNYKPYVERLDRMPDHIIREVEVAGDENYKVPENSWTNAPINCPSLMKRGLEVMDDERWFLVTYTADTPPPK